MVAVQCFGNEQQSVPTKYFDLLHTDLNLTPVWQAHQMKGEAVLTLTPYFQPQKMITLDAKSMTVDKISLILKSGNIDLKYNSTQTKLIIFLDKTYTSKDTLKLSILYTANPDSVKGEDGKAIKQDKGLYFINTDGKRKGVPTHLWTQGETQANSCWFPTFDHPSEKHTQTLKVTYDEKYVSLSNGKLVSSKKNTDGTKTDYWVQKLPHSVYLTVLVIGDYKIVKDKWKDKEVAYYMEPQYENMARPIFGRTPEMIEFFSNKLGVEFPWDKYSQVIVHDFVAGAMENTSAVTFNTMFQKDERELIDANDDETVAHELFHHWFGDLATCESWSHLTLNESFANYSEYLWYEYKYGKDEAENHWYRDLSPYFSMASRKREPLVRYDYTKPDDMFDLISYNKGGKILHMLRKYLGDEAFFKSLKLYLTKFSFKTAEYTDLRKSFEEVTGEDLTWFFDQWYLKGGHPTITSSYRKEANKTVLTISQKHNFDTSFIYKLPLDIDVYTGDIAKRKRIVLNKAKDSFEIYEQDVKAVVVDGTNSLVGVKTEVRPVEDWVFVLQNSDSYLDKSTAIRKLKNHKGKDIVKNALFDALSSPKSRVVTSAIKMIESSWLEKEEKWNTKLIEIAKQNIRGTTRAAALEKLAENKDLKKYEDLVAEKLKDSSYSVEDEALKFLTKIDSNKALEYAKANINRNHFGLISTIYELIGNNKNPQDSQLFINGIDQAKGYKKIAIYMNYGKYLASMSANTVDEKLVEFEKMITSDDDIEVYCAKSALGSMKSEFSKNSDAKSKERMAQIEKIIAKAKTKDEEEG